MPAPVQPLPAMPLGYGRAEPQIPLLGPRRVLPVDRVMGAFFFMLVATTCLYNGMAPHGDLLGPMALLFAVWGCGYLLVRIWNAPAVATALRAQLIVAALLCVVSTVAAAWIYFDWPYDRRRTVVRPHPPSLYVAAAMAGVSAAWFAAVTWRVRRTARNGRRVLQTKALKEEP